MSRTLVFILGYPMALYKLSYYYYYYYCYPHHYCEQIETTDCS